MVENNSPSQGHSQSFPQDEFGCVNDPTQPSQQQVNVGEDGGNGAFNLDNPHEYNVHDAEFPLPPRVLEERAKAREGK